MAVLFNFSLSFSSYEHRRHTALQHNVIKGGRKSDGDAEKQALLEAERNDKTEIVAESSAAANGSASKYDDVVLRKPKKNFFKSPLLYQNALL